MNKKDTLIVLGFIVCFIVGMFTLQFIKSVEIMSEDRLEQIKYDASLIGYNTALSQIISEVIKCQQPLPIKFDNGTINLFAVECLNLNNDNQEVK